jgi:hypothetical protein
MNDEQLELLNARDKDELIQLVIKLSDIKNKLIERNIILEQRLEQIYDLDDMIEGMDE